MAPQSDFWNIISGKKVTLVHKEKQDKKQEYSKPKIRSLGKVKGMTQGGSWGGGGWSGGGGGGGATPGLNQFGTGS